MAWDESKTWLTGSTSGALYKNLLDENDKWEKLYKDIITNQGR